METLLIKSVKKIWADCRPPRSGLVQKITLLHDATRKTGPFLRGRRRHCNCLHYCYIRYTVTPCIRSYCNVVYLFNIYLQSRPFGLGSLSFPFKLTLTPQWTGHLLHHRCSGWMIRGFGGLTGWWQHYVTPTGDF